MEKTEWLIDYTVTRCNDNEYRATFTHDGKLLGEITLDSHDRNNPDVAFFRLVHKPTRWNVLPDDLHEALVIYRRETIADVDYRDKVYRFLRVKEWQDAHWRLTTDKSDIKIPKEPKKVA